MTIINYHKFNLAIIFCSSWTHKIKLDMKLQYFVKCNQLTFVILKSISDNICSIQNRHSSLLFFCCFFAVFLFFLLLFTSFYFFLLLFTSFYLINFSYFNSKMLYEKSVFVFLNIFFLAFGKYYFFYMIESIWLILSHKLYFYKHYFNKIKPFSWLWKWIYVNSILFILNFHKQTSLEKETLVTRDIHLN